MNPPVISCESLDIEALSPRDQAMYVLGVCAAARTYGHGTLPESIHVIADRHAGRMLAGEATGLDESKVREFMRQHLDQVASFSRTQRILFSSRTQRGFES